MPNHLINENSPYLLQHAHNPVDWYPWGEEAFSKAKAEDKPVFLSIGYAACHWCHVMAHESFEDPATAALLNSHFINIKVDREERPDLDSIYMQAVLALTGHGGWPMSVFLTPEGKPFYGGTYFPPARRYNLPSFRELLETLAHLWQAERARLLDSSEQIMQHLLAGQASAAPNNLVFSPQLLDEVTPNLARSYDWKHGGWGPAPKFPQPMTIEYLLRRSTRGDKMALEMAEHALRAMSQGGMYDVVGGGFARYSTDEQWCVPHFEKMLYDNAQLALVYLHGWLVTGELHFRRVCEETLDFALRELRHPQGGFFSSLDADSEGEEGKFYTWNSAEIAQVFANDKDFEFFKAAYTITDQGNYESVNILQRRAADAELTVAYGITPEQVIQWLNRLQNTLFERRAVRVRPGTDDKVLTAWNGLMLIALAEAARYLGRTDYLEAARLNAAFLLSSMRNEQGLLRSWREGQARHTAYLEDYAALILGLLALYPSDPDPKWYAAARELTEELIRAYSDSPPGSGFFDTSSTSESLLYRPKDLQDNATPSGNALAVCALLILSTYEGRSDWRSQAEAILAGMQENMLRYPTAFAQWLCAADFAAGPTQEVAIIGAYTDPRTSALSTALWQRYRPHQVVAITTYPPEPGSPALLHQRPMLNNLPTAYVCQGFECHLPVNAPEELLAQFIKLD